LIRAIPVEVNDAGEGEEVFVSAEITNKIRDWKKMEKGALKMPDSTATINTRSKS
jgi:hypothetical protein